MRDTRDTDRHTRRFFEVNFKKGRFLNKDKKANNLWFKITFINQNNKNAILCSTRKERKGKGILKGPWSGKKETKRALEENDNRNSMAHKLGGRWEPPPDIKTD